MHIMAQEPGWGPGEAHVAGHTCQKDAYSGCSAAEGLRAQNGTAVTEMTGTSRENGVSQSHFHHPQVPSAS